MKHALTGLVVIAIAAAASLLPMRPYMDFQLIFHANLGLLRGIALYDRAGQVNMIAELAQVPASRVYVLPFPYPPWYALSTLWLALLPIDLAVRAWFAANLAMLMLSLWLLTQDQSGLRRVLRFSAGLGWLPILGGLFVGQYGFPVLLGAALTSHALRRQNAILLALGAILLTFKPHLGGLVLLMVAVQLVLRRDRFGRWALVSMAAVALGLLVVGFAASPNWPVEYFRSLTGFRDVSKCGQCVSLSMAAAGAMGGAFEQATWIAIVIGVALLLWLVRGWHHFTATPGWLVTTGIVLTMLVSPYLQNYDYLLLVVPFIHLAARARRAVEWITLGAAYVIPWLGLAVWGTGGNNSLIISAVILFAMAASVSRRETESPVSSEAA